VLLRVGGIYGRGGRNFGSTALARLRAGERLRVDGERLVQPSWVGRVAEQTLVLLGGEQLEPARMHRGLFHAMCHGETTWADFSRELARLAGLPLSLIESVSTSALGTAALRPARAALENRALARLGAGTDSTNSFDVMGGWRDALAAYLEEALR
jgi:dTDP-4-dehydrorhamnose reductase